jgi:hypothetical protein
MSVFTVDYTASHATRQYSSQSLLRQFQISNNVSLTAKKGKVVPVVAMKAYRGEEVQLHSFLKSVVGGGEWSIKCSGRFTPRKERQYQLKRRLDGPQSPSGRFWRREYVLPLPGFVPRTVQYVDSRNTDCTIPAPSFTGYLHNLKRPIQSHLT